MGFNKANHENDGSNLTFLSNKNYESRNRNTAEIEKSPLFFSKRLLISILIFLWNVIITVIRNNINVAIVEMTSNKIANRGNQTMELHPEFQWNSQTITFVLSLIFYGALLSFMNGFVVSKLGGMMTCTLSLIMCSITTLLHPATLRYNFYLFVACRLITGIFLGFYYSCFFEIFSRWIPKRERLKLMTFCYGGIYIGAVLVYPLCGTIASEWGWSMVFYCTGSICTIMALLCPIILKSDPSKDKLISKKELLYILDGTEISCNKKQVIYPYKSILTSGPIGALCMAVIATNCGLTFLLDCLPLYIKDVTGKDTVNVGIISSIPNIVTLIVYFFAGVLLVNWKNKTNISSTLMHKILMGAALFSQSFLFLALTLVTNFTIIILILVAMRLFTPFSILIQQLIVVDIAPGYTAMVSGLVSFCSCLSIVLTQMGIGFITTNHNMEEWHRCFILIACILTICAAIFILFGSSDPQSWSLSTKIEAKLKSSQTNVKLTEK